MKTRNNLLRFTLIVAFSFLLSGNLFARKALKKGEPIKKTTAITIVEAEIKIENWMLDLNYLVHEFESSIMLENWMFDTNYLFTEFTINENKLELENWMSDICYIKTD